MEQDRTALNRQQELYWKQLIELKVTALYTRLYRDLLGRRVALVATVRAIASSASIGVWAVWKQYPLVWGGIIALSQVADAVKDVFPINKKQKSASELTIALDRIFIDAQFEWEGIFAGKLSDEQIAGRLRKLRRLQHDTESHHFKEGLPHRKTLQRAAEEEATGFFDNVYGVNSSEGDTDG